MEDGGKKARNSRESDGVLWKKRVMEVAEDHLEKCANVQVDIEVLESLMEPENLEVSLRYVLKHASSSGSNVFQLFDTSEKPNHFVASRRRWLESRGKNGARQENGKSSGMTLSIKELWQKPRRAPTEPYKRLCLSKVRRQPEKKKAIGS